MKSSAATIGLFPASGMAKVLEDSARNGDLPTIYSLHPTFLKVWMGYKEKLEPQFMTSQGKKKKTADTLTNNNDDDEKDSLKKVISSLTDFDMHAADSAMKTLLSFQYGKETSVFVKQLEQAVSQMDVSLASDPAGKLALRAKNNQLGK